MYSPAIPTGNVQITSFTFSESDAGGWGTHVGGDVTYFFGPNLGLGFALKAVDGLIDRRVDSIVVTTTFIALYATGVQSDWREGCRCVTSEAMEWRGTTRAEAEAAGFRPAGDCLTP